MIDGADTADCGCKVGRAIDEYGLADCNGWLRDRWTGRQDGDSVRELTAEFNRRVLRAAMTDQGTNPLDGEVENLHRLLTDDDVSGGMRTQARKRLERRGVPIDRVERQFVSHQTVYRHLTGCLDVERQSSGGTTRERIERNVRKLRALRQRTEAVTDETVERLATADRVEIDEFDVLVDVSVVCAACGSQHDPDALLLRGGCDCDR